jgi:hypothetical protein
MTLYDRLADLSLQIDSVGLADLVRPPNGGFERRTTVIRLHGNAEQGIGEDVNYQPAEQLLLQRQGLDLPIRGRHRLDDFERLLDELDLFDRDPQSADSRDYRRWAVSSAALDLALRQAQRSLHDVLGITPKPVRFVKSMGLGDGPGIEPVTRILEYMPALRFKLDAAKPWDDSTVDGLRRTGAVDVVDLKGFYSGTPVDLAADPALYLRVARGLPDVWIEDPALTDDTRPVLEGYRDRITWDAPIHSVADIEGLPFRPRMLNMKPSRFGSLRRVFDAYDWCREHDVGMYGGGQYELGPGRGHLHYLASLFHPEAPNDVAPTAYHDIGPQADLPPSPLAPAPRTTGFAWREFGQEGHR